MLQSLCTTIPTSSYSHSQTSSYQTPPLPNNAIQLHTIYRKKLTYLTNLGILDTNPKITNIPSHQTLDQILTIIDYLKSKGFSDTDISKLSTKCPKLFSSNLEPSDIQPVFHFLNSEVNASISQTCGLILHCPEILFSNVEYCLRPTLVFLRNLGLEKLNIPNNLNAHLLNTRVKKFEEKIEFFMGIGFGFGFEDSMKICGRFPAIFGYSTENNLRPKIEYLVEGMGKNVKELKDFPQYFAYSLRKRIVPRHLHLKQRGVDISLKRMLLCGDEKFYAKWK